MATIDGSIVIISMPAIFRGIHLNPTAPGNISYLLWMIIGYLLVTAVVVVTLELVVVGGAVVVVVRRTACRWPGELLHEASAHGTASARATKASGPRRCMASLCPVPSAGKGHRRRGYGRRGA